MAALDYLHRAGLTVELNGDKLRLRPAELITDVVRLYVRDHRPELIVELNACNDASHCWLHLLVLSDGNVVQTSSTLNTATVERHARQRYQERLLAVVAVPGFERALREDEIVKALTGTLTAPAPVKVLSSTWLKRVASLLGVEPGALQEEGHIEQCDIAQAYDISPADVAQLIRSSPMWLNRSHVLEQRIIIDTDQHNDEPQRVVLTAASASAEWRAADVAQTNHLMTCRDCSAQSNRYCPTGTQLRQQYDSTPWN